MQTNQKLRATLLCTAISLGVMFCQALAYAGSCDNLDQNSTWLSLHQKLSDAYKQEDWRTVIQYSKQLEAICDRAPVLNYIIARTHKSLGDDEKYLFYLQKATQNTEHFATDKDILDRMWSEKYIATHPEADPQNIAELNNTITLLTADLEKYQIDSKNSISSEQYIENQMTDYKTPLWIGTGIGIGGIAFAALGATLLVVSPEPFTFIPKPPVPGKYKENTTHALGWSFVGAGTAMTITGAILAGIYGYKYKHRKDNLSISFNISPVDASIHFGF